MSEKKPRILMTIDAFHVGGTETHLLSITKELLRQGIFVAILATKRGSMLNEFLTLGCPVYIGFNDSLFSKSKIKQIILENNINIVHSHDLTACLMYETCKEMGIPQIYSMHAIYMNPHDHFDLNFINIISVSPPIFDWLKGIGIPSTLIPNGIDIKEYNFIPNSELRNKLDIPEEAPVILYASRLGDARKSEICKLFLEASIQIRNEKFPSLHVVVVGESLDRNYLVPLLSLVESAHSTTDKKFIHMLGKRRDLPELYSLANCVVGTGRVALEAMACERVVIAVGNNGYFGIVKPKNINTAWRYYFGDHKSIKSETIDLIARDLKKVLLSPIKQSNFGKKGREYISQNFEIESVVNQLILKYLSLVAK
ncbi:glycosyltransferase [Bacillus sp. CGMCC 1.16607]|uniref:glycosyltransferase n=1 Tax=Bacillus sp. CGMCC 1.16607 TaxID=3351842 RepID=UPI003642DC0D